MKKNKGFQKGEEREIGRNLILKNNDYKHPKSVEKKGHTDSSRLKDLNR